MLYLLFGFIMLLILEVDEPTKKVGISFPFEVMIVLLFWPFVAVFFGRYMYKTGKMSKRYKSFKNKIDSIGDS